MVQYWSWCGASWTTASIPQRCGARAPKVYLLAPRTQDGVPGLAAACSGEHGAQMVRSTQVLGPLGTPVQPKAVVRVKPPPPGAKAPPAQEAWARDQTAMSAAAGVPSDPRPLRTSGDAQTPTHNRTLLLSFSCCCCYYCA